MISSRRGRRTGTDLIEDPTERNRTGLKRKRGLMKKAAELAKLTDTEVLLLTRSATPEKRQRVMAFSSLKRDWIQAWQDVVSDISKYEATVQSATQDDYETVFGNASNWSQINNLPYSISKKSRPEIEDDIDKADNISNLVVVPDLTPYQTLDTQPPEQLAQRYQSHPAFADLPYSVTESRASLALQQVIGRGQTQNQAVLERIVRHRDRELRKRFGKNNFIPHRANDTIEKVRQFECYTSLSHHVHDINVGTREITFLK